MLAFSTLDQTHTLLLQLMIKKYEKQNKNFLGAGKRCRSHQDGAKRRLQAVEGSGVWACRGFCSYTVLYEAAKIRFSCDVDYNTLQKM